MIYSWKPRTIFSKKKVKEFNLFLCSLKIYIACGTMLSRTSSLCSHCVHPSALPEVPAHLELSLLEHQTGSNDYVTGVCIIMVFRRNMALISTLCVYINISPNKISIYLLVPFLYSTMAWIKNNFKEYYGFTLGHFIAKLASEV